MITVKERLIEILESFRRKYHYYVDEDCWYSCPAHPDYCGDKDNTRCECGLDEHNKKIDGALEILEKMLPTIDYQGYIGKLER